MGKRYDIHENFPNRPGTMIKHVQAHGHQNIVIILKFEPRKSIGNGDGNHENA
jgi:hypothetical protein